MGYCYACNTNYYGNSCNCKKTVNICDPCNTNTGCPLQLDWSCSIYHKSNNEVTELTCLGLTNGATLEQFAEAVDALFCPLIVEDYDLPCLRETLDYTINSMEQFAEAVDTEICALRTEIEDVAEDAVIPITANDSTSIDFTVSGAGSHTITGSVIISPNANNQLSNPGNGLFSAPQTLSINYTTNEISITSGNTIDLTPLLCTAEGFLGNISADPSDPEEGQYWYNTVAGQLRIQVNNAVYSITITAV
jgi:hypothetical protein